MQTNPLLNKKAFLYLSEFISGTAVMGIEIAANRLLAPYLSSSQVVLTIITGVVLIAMSIGNVLGGKLSDKYKDIRYLYIFTLIAGAYVILIPFIGKYVIGGIAILFALFVNGGLIIYTTIISCLLLIAPPLLLLGMVTPSLIKFTMGNVSSGKIIGSLEALNTTGSIIGTFIPTFLTIPYIGTLYTFVIFGSLLITLSLVFIITGFIYNHMDGIKPRKPKIIKESILIFLSLLVMILSLIVGKSHKISLSSGYEIYEGESMYNYLRVEETESSYYFSTNVLFGIQSMMNKDKTLTGMYYDYCLAAPYMAHSKDKDKIDVLILGNGTGTYATLMKKYIDTESDIVGIEIDQRIIDLSYEYFMMDEDIEVHADDGRSYLSRDKNKYDVIMVDAYSSISAPFQMTTVEFFRLVKEHLTDDGVMVMNINMVLEKEDSINQSLADTTSSVFDKTYTYKLGGSSNMIVFASSNSNFVNEFSDNLGDVENDALRSTLHLLLSGIEEHIDTGIRLYDTSADVEVKSMNAVDGIIMEELSYYRQIFKEKGLKGIIELLS